MIAPTAAARAAWAGADSSKGLYSLRIRAKASNRPRKKAAEAAA